MATADEAILKRIMPHSIEAEQSVIGAMIMDHDAIVYAAEIVSGADFYNPQYGVVFDAMVELSNEGTPADLITLQNRLREKDVPPEVSSLEFIRDLMTAALTSANIKHYAQIVADKSILRKLIRINEEIAANCYAGKDSRDTILEDAEKRIFDLIQRGMGGDFVPIRKIVVAALESIEQAAKNKGNVTGIATGFMDLDYRTAGLQNADLVLLAARPSVGKTALALNIASHAAFNLNHCVAVFSLEMSKEQLVNRLFSMGARIDSQRLRTGNLSDGEWEKLSANAGIIGKSNLIIDDTPGISIPELRSKCRKFKLEHNLRMVIIDYLQLMSGHGNRFGDSRQQEISDISRALKAIARELDVPVVALSQLNRSVESRPDRRPLLSDLRDSGAIEQDADIVMFLYRDEYYDKETEKKGIAEVIIAKHRNGPTGTSELAFFPEHGRFANLARH